MRLATLLTGLILAAGCSHGPAPQASVPKKAEAAPAMSAKPVEPPKAAPPDVPKPPPPHAAIDTTPIKVDLTKAKWATEEATLFGYDDGESKLFYFANGKAEFTVKLPAEGDYQIVVTASSQPALNEQAKFKVEVDGKPAGAETLCATEEAKDYAFPAKLAAGERKIAVSFTNDVYKENEYDRNFYLNGLKVVRTK
jgi:predicted xylan-binding protein with Ca-dependent carbohydrate-binding module